MYWCAVCRDRQIDSQGLRNIQFVSNSLSLSPAGRRGHAREERVEDTGKGDRRSSSPRRSTLPLLVVVKGGAVCRPSCDSLGPALLHKLEDGTPVRLAGAAGEVVGVHLQRLEQLFAVLNVHSGA